MKFDVHGQLDFAAPEAIRAEQTRLLNEHIDYCRKHSPYYRKLLRGLGSAPLTPGDLADLPTTGKADLAAAGGKVDYLEVLDSGDLEAVDGDTKEVLLAAAVFFGTTRLIDNELFGVGK